jgi:hypothetical protein
MLLMLNKILLRHTASRVRCRNGPCSKLWLGRAAVPTVMV